MVMLVDARDQLSLDLLDLRQNTHRDAITKDSMSFVPSHQDRVEVERRWHIGYRP